MSIEQSRLWNNLWRDINNDFRQDESLSILNTSSRDIEVTDSTTGVTKIVYPRSVLHTNRPTKSIIITQGKLRVEIPRSEIKKDMISIETPIKFSESTNSYGDLLSLGWVNKVLSSADRIIITKHSVYYIVVESCKQGSYVLLLIVLAIICAACLCLL